MMESADIPIHHVYPQNTATVATEIEQEITQGICFEGPEKKLEIDFRPIPGDTVGFRRFSQKQLQKLILDPANCTIISSLKNAEFDSYVLSESSLFVFPYKVLLKTCGTTTLLASVPNLLELAKQVGTEVDFVTYSRKNYNFPEAQPQPHSSFSEEVRYLNLFFEGTPYIFGPMTSDHWYLYVADYSQPEVSGNTEYTLEIMMSELDAEVMQQFYKKDGVTVKETTEKSGISGIIPNSQIDDCQFEPCGYSMNGQLGGIYSTIHITPEPQCSYVSYETNLPTPKFTTVLEKVIQTFKPGRFSVALFIENAREQDLQGSINKNVTGYKLTHKHEIVFGEETNIFRLLYCNYKLLP